LVAVTEQLYAVPLLSPVMVIGLEAPVAVRVVPPPVHDAVYPLIAAPPSDEGAVKATVALPLPAVAVPMVGAPGGVGVELPPPPPPPPPQAASVEKTRAMNSAGSAESSLAVARDYRSDSAVSLG